MIIINLINFVIIIIYSKIDIAGIKTGRNIEAFFLASKVSFLPPFLSMYVFSPIACFKKKKTTWQHLSSILVQEVPLRLLKLVK